MDNYLAGISCGLGVWLFAWGMNRAYLLFKNIIS